MKPIKSLLVFAILVFAPAVASAQYYGGGGGYYQQPSRIPGGFHDRTGRLAWGGSIGLGGMHDDGNGFTNCDNCSNGPVLELDGHLGGMISPRFALLFEGQLNARTIHSDFYNGDTVLTQSAGMVAGQFWITPQLWVKGGIGLAGLQADDRYFTYDYGTGLAVMGAVGFEILSARWFAVDLQGRIIQGEYRANGGDDLHVTAANVGLGLNWY